MIQRFRDITLMEMTDLWLTVACDGCSGVGMRSQDVVAADGRFVGYRTALVPLMETLAMGAQPQLIINTLSVAFDAYGHQIFDGIRDAARESGLTGEDVITGSTEDNFVVPVTSIGVTVLGQMPKRAHDDSLINVCDVYLVGLPKVGPEVITSAGEILSLQVMQQLLQIDAIVDILPVGSRGIRYEMQVMCDSRQATVSWADGMTVDVDQSAGPATCAIVAYKQSTDTSPLDQLGIPVVKLGYLAPCKE